MALVGPTVQRLSLKLPSADVLGLVETLGLGFGVNLNPTTLNLNPKQLHSVFEAQSFT